MVVRQIVEMDIMCADTKLLPFFEVTAGARRFVYSCESYSPGSGANVVVYYEDDEGIARRYVYLTGLITCTPDEIAEIIREHFGEERSEQPLWEFTEDEIRVFAIADHKRKLNLAPIYEGHELIRAKEFRKLFDLASSIRRIGSLDILCSGMARYVVGDGESRKDFTTKDELEGDGGKLNWLFKKAIEKKWALARKLRRKAPRGTCND